MPVPKAISSPLCRLSPPYPGRHIGSPLRPCAPGKPSAGSLQVVASSGVKSRGCFVRPPRAALLLLSKCKKHAPIRLAGMSTQNKHRHTACLGAWALSRSFAPIGHRAGTRSRFRSCCWAEPSPFRQPPTCIHPQVRVRSWAAMPSVPCRHSATRLSAASRALHDDRSLRRSREPRRVV